MKFFVVFYFGCAGVLLLPCELLVVGSGDCLVAGLGLLIGCFSIAGSGAGCVGFRR